VSGGPPGGGASVLVSVPGKGGMTQQARVVSAASAARVRRFMSV